MHGEYKIVFSKSLSFFEEKKLLTQMLNNMLLFCLRIYLYEFCPNWLACWVVIVKMLWRVCSMISITAVKDVIVYISRHSWTPTCQTWNACYTKIYRTWVTHFSGVRVTRSLVLCVCFVDRCVSFCTFSFGHCVVCSSIYGFWLPLWYLQTLLSSHWEMLQVVF